MKKLFILLLLVVILLSGCSCLNNTRYLMCGADYDQIKDKGIGVISMGIVANLGANYAANQCVTFEVVISFGDSDKVIEKSKNSNEVHYVKTSIDFSNYNYVEER
jgi:hypothetical protein